MAADIAGAAGDQDGHEVSPSSLPGLTPQVGSTRLAALLPVANSGKPELGAIHHESMSYWVYILASGPGGTLYIGMTNNLIRRTFEHREGLVPGFTKRYEVKRLVYYEQHDTAVAAIQREKNIKHWSREWKIDLIRSINPEWRDLYDDIVR